MASDFFKKMDRREKAAFINRTLEQGGSFKDIYDATMPTDELAESREVLLDQFRKAGYKVNQDLTAPDQEETGEAAPESGAGVEGDDPAISARLDQLVQVADDLLLMLSWWKSAPEAELKSEGREGEIPLGGEEIRKTIRINRQVWDEWKDFCTRQPHSREKDLLAKALLAYITKSN